VTEAMPSVSSAKPILDGLRVVELSAFVAAPLGGATLASLGAEVVRVDPIGGGIDAHRWPEFRGQSLYWAGLNQGKRSVTIDTRAPRGEALVIELVEKAGIVLTNLPVRQGLSYERLRAARPDLIMLVITGASDGTTAVDYTVNAGVGFPWVTGPASHAGPVNHVLPAWDALTGYLAATAILAAELRRRTSGEGQLITLSLADVALSVAGNLGLIAEAELVAEPRARFGNHLYGSFARDFRTKDGRYAIAVALTPRQWRSLVTATGIQSAIAAIERGGLRLEREGDRFAAREDICAALEPWFASHTLEEIERIFTEADVLWGPYRTFKEMIEREKTRTTKNPMLQRVDQPLIGSYDRTATPLEFTGAPRIPARPSPVIGADTRSVLSEWLGVEAGALDALVADGVIA
jgi:2-methylfumaryl-CoA isomerase